MRVQTRKKLVLILIFDSISLKTLFSVVWGRSFGYHSHPYDIQRKISGDDLFEDQLGLLNWVSFLRISSVITQYVIQMKSVLVDSMSTIVKPFDLIFNRQFLHP